MRFLFFLIWDQNTKKIRQNKNNVLIILECLLYAIICIILNALISPKLQVRKLDSET